MLTGDDSAGDGDALTAEQLDHGRQRQADDVARAPVDRAPRTPRRRPGWRRRRPCPSVRPSPGTTRSRRPSSMVIDTDVVTTSCTVRPSRRTTTAVWTRWVRPESDRSIRRASSSSAGLPRISPSTSTVVSAASTTRTVDRTSGDRVGLVDGQAAHELDRRLARADRFVDVGRDDLERQPEQGEQLTPARRSAGEHQPHLVSPRRPPSRRRRRGSSDRRGRRGKPSGRATLTGPLAWPRLIRSPPSTSSADGSRPPSRSSSSISVDTCASRWRTSGPTG